MRGAAYAEETPMKNAGNILMSSLTIIDPVKHKLRSACYSAEKMTKAYPPLRADNSGWENPRG